MSSETTGLIRRAAPLRFGLVAGLCLLLAGPSFPTRGPDSDAAQEEGLDGPMERGRTATRWFYEGELERILEFGVTDDMREAIPDLEAWERVREQVLSQLGDEIEVVDETLTVNQGMQVYLRLVHFAQTGTRPMIVQWAFDSRGRIAGFYVRPQEP